MSHAECMHTAAEGVPSAILPKFLDPATRAEVARVGMMAVTKEARHGTMTTGGRTSCSAAAGKLESGD